MQIRCSQCALALLIAAGSCAPVLAIQPAQPAPAPVEAPLPADALSGEVVAVLNKVEIRQSNNDPWVKAEVGQKIGAGASIRTGPKSAIQVRVAGTQLLTIDRISLLSLQQAIREAGVNKTEIDLDYGRVKFDVTSTEFANDVVIKAPDATLAVKGTEGAMEVTGGHPTLAYGSQGNTGRIVVEYGKGDKAEIKDSSKSSSKTTDPAKYGDEETFVDGEDGQARDEGEESATDRSPGGGGLGSGFLFDGFDTFQTAPEPGPGSWVAVADIESGLIYRRDLINGSIRPLADSPVEFQTGGMAIRDAEPEGKGKGNKGAAGLQLLLLEGGNLGNGSEEKSEAFNELYVANIGNGNARGEVAEFTLLAKFTNADPGEINEGGDVLAGLGIVDGELYSTNLTSGFESNLDTIVRLDIESQTYSDVMNFGQGFAARNLMGAPDRGSLFVVGNLVDTGNSGPLERLTVLDFDPRNNYVADSFSGAAGDFRISQGTIIDRGVDPALFDSDSLDVQGVTFANGRLILAVEGSNGEKGTRTNAFIRINPNAQGSSRSPYVSQVSAGRNRGVTGLGSGARARSRDMVVLSDPEGPIDTTTINAMFATLAYSERALRSGALQHMVGSEIIGTSIDPAGCAASELISMIPDAMLQHVNQTSGIGRTVAHLRDNLPDGHPCLPSGGRRRGD